MLKIRIIYRPYRLFQYKKKVRGEKFILMEALTKP